ncbi:MAG: flagellar basal body-associated FliL family protein [Burkholderiales bacterium]|nr:flagellar basal body-associated FliL family protein [Burkholderiales bacterium]
MSKEKASASLLSAQLDFEGWDEISPSQDDFSLLDFILPETPGTGIPPISPLVDQPVPPPKPVAAIVQPVSVSKPMSERKPVKNSKNANLSKKGNADNFARYAAIFALVALVFVFAGLFYSNVGNKNAAGLSYIILPKNVTNLKGQVISMQVTIQVNHSDEYWLQENKKVLADLFQIEVAKIDPGDLHSEEGFEAVQTQLKTGMNKALQDDKIQSVLLTELLIQNRN